MLAASSAVKSLAAARAMRAATRVSGAGTGPATRPGTGPATRIKLTYKLLGPARTAII